MTVETTARKASFAGGQSVLTFTFRTLVSNPEYIQVAVVNLTSSTQTLLVYNVGYTVSVNSNGVGGTVTVSPTFSTANNYVVFRQTAALQDSAYTDFNQFPASTLENNLDQLTMVAQEQEEDNQRTLTYPIAAPSASTTLPVPLGSAFLQWNAGGTALVNSVIPDPSTLIKATTVEAQAGTEDSHFMTPLKTAQAIAALGINVVSSSTTDITVISGSTTIISSVNADTGGSNKILRLDSLGKLPAVDGSQLTAIPNMYVKCSNSQSVGVSSGTAVVGSWQTTTINTKNFDTASIATISSSTISLPAGTYKVYSHHPFNATGASQTRLWNFTDGALLLTGNGANATINNQDAYSVITGEITIASTKKIALQYQVSNTAAAKDLGFPCGFGTEVYAQIEFTKIA